VDKEIKVLLSLSSAFLQIIMMKTMWLKNKKELTPKVNQLFLKIFITIM